MEGEGGGAGGSHPALHIPQVLAALCPPIPSYFPHSWVPIPLSTSPRSWQLPIPSYSPHSLFPSRSKYPPGPGSSLLPHPLLFPSSWRFPPHSPFPPGPGSSLLPPPPPIPPILEVPIPLSPSPRSWQLRAANPYLSRGTTGPCSTPGCSRPCGSRPSRSRCRGGW